tara:strand:+ start:99 stop:1016 length:918 start_codon:yes stop_codon:yes gene_type:complete
MLDFENIAPYLKDPLVLIGFFMFIVFLLLRVIIKQNIIPTLTKKDGFSFLKTILLYGFIFGIVLMTLGFGLKYREISEKEQKTIVALLHSELDENLKTINELKLNTENYLKINLNLSTVIRTDGIKLLGLMFSEKNVDLDSEINTVELANNSFNYIIEKKIYLNKLEMDKLDASGKSIRATIERTIPTLKSLADSTQTRYLINKTIWKSNLSSYKKIDILDITEFQNIYSEMQLIRNDYSVIANNSINFYRSVSEFFNPKEQINKEKLASALSSERQTYRLIHDYTLNLHNATEKIITLSSQLNK